jgi:hypothetical protein
MSSLKSSFNILGRTAIALQLHIVKQRMPHVHRGWVASDHDVEGIRPETDREYLARLRQLAQDRALMRRRRASQAPRYRRLQS